MKYLHLNYASWNKQQKHSVEATETYMVDAGHSEQQEELS